MTATKRNLPFLVLLIIAGEAIFFLPFVLPRIFRHTILEYYAFTDFELGLAFSAYGIVAIASYFFGIGQPITLEGLSSGAERLE